MYGIDHDANTPGFQDGLNTVGDLSRQFFLNLQSPGKRFDHACEFADADDFLVRQVADMCDADYRRHVVFAVRFESNIAQDDQFIVAFDFFECSLQELDGILAIAPEPVLVSQGDTLRRIEQAFTLRIITSPAQEYFYSLFSLLSAWAFGWGDIIGFACQFGRLISDS